MLGKFKRILLIPIIMIVISILSCGVCSWYENYDHFKKTGGIIIDNPVKNSDNTWFLPIKFDTRIMNSAQVFRDVRVYRKDDVIKIRLLVAVVDSFGRKWEVKGADLGKLPDGTYHIQYLNSDGSTVDVGKIEIQN
jgi:hypothetical protein